MFPPSESWNIGYFRVPLLRLFYIVICVSYFSLFLSPPKFYKIRGDRGLGNSQYSMTQKGETQENEKGKKREYECMYLRSLSQSPHFFPRWWHFVHITFDAAEILNLIFLQQTGMRNRWRNWRSLACVRTIAPPLSSQEPLLSFRTVFPIKFKYPPPLMGFPQRSANLF